MVNKKRITVLEEKCNQAEEPYKAVEKDVSPKTKFNCKTCEESFEIKKNLRVHMLEKYLRKVKCKDCYETFDKSCDLEVHIEVHLKLTRQFECEKCEKKFVLQWRLKKHQQIHETQNTKRCHHFNNKKVCPFEDLGCMFDHVLSGMCKYGKVGSNKLCQFQNEIGQKGVEEINSCIDLVNVKTVNLNVRKKKN